MNLPNLITLSRIPLMFIIVGLMYQAWPGAASLAFWFFIAAAVGDWLDGYLARKQGLVSNFGKLMDALTDKIMVLGLIIALVDLQHVASTPQAAHLPNLLWLALITLVREFLVTGMRMVAATKGVVVSADGGGKSKTVTQLIGLGFLLATPMVARDWARFVAVDLTEFSLTVYRIGYFIFALGTALAVWSGTRYILRYKAVVFGDAAG
jgi:CDP-diacylglycerol--glycerol-3-phosphate 3-phosphatidyltransferase